MLLCRFLLMKMGTLTPTKMETSAHQHVETAEMCCPSCHTRTPASAVEGQGFPWIQCWTRQSLVSLSCPWESQVAPDARKRSRYQKRSLVLHPNSVLLSHRNISERREGSSGPQKIFFLVPNSFISSFSLSDKPWRVNLFFLTLHLIISLCV